eukprot:4651183-Amphidinium_carterae.1
MRAAESCSALWTSSISKGRSRRALRRQRRVSVLQKLVNFSQNIGRSKGEIGFEVSSWNGNLRMTVPSKSII